MATKIGQNSRLGLVKSRSQILNPATGNYIKRDTATGKFLDVKKDGTAFKGVRKEVVTIRTNPNLNKLIAEKAEKAVLEVRNKTL